MNIADLPPLQELLPHRGMSLLLDQVLAHDGAKTTCSIGLKDQVWLKNADGRIANCLTLEYMAQCVAAHESIRAWLAGHPADIGMIAAVSDMQVHVPVLEPNQKLRVSSAHIRGNRKLRAFRHACSVFDENDATVAESRITIALGTPTPKRSA
ncbi:MAG: hypothetical protein VX574_01885 [Myxococcota bacterium]|nr:hypothetical protein [Myxococcota bacterium]